MKALFVKYRLLLVALAGASLFYLGWLTHGWKTDSKELKEAKVAVQQTHQSIKKSDEIENKAIDRKDQVRVQYKTITKEIVKYVPQTVHDKCIASDGTIVATTLSAGAVSVLNADETSPGVQPASLSDEESAAATEVGLQELSQHIATLKEKYGELAADHDALVEYNEWYEAQTTPKP